MSGRKRNKRMGICLMLLTSCLVLAAVWVVLATPKTALAGKPDKPEKPGKGGEVAQEIPVCIAFHDVIGDDGTKGAIQNDGDAYCDGDSGGKVTAIVGRNFNIVLETNNCGKRTAGRTLRLDLTNALGCTASVKVDVSDGAGGDPDGVCDDCLDSVPDLPTVRFGTLPSGQKSGYPDSAKFEILGRDLDGLRVGDTVETNARLSFSVGGQGWILHWGPHKVSGGWTYAPATAPITVYRETNDIWQIYSSPTDSKACLYRDNNPPHRATEYHGQVMAPFFATAEAITHEETVWGDEPWNIELGVGPCE